MGLSRDLALFDIQQLRPEDDSARGRFASSFFDCFDRFWALFLWKSPKIVSGFTDLRFSVPPGPVCTCFLGTFSVASNLKLGQTLFFRPSSLSIPSG